MSVKEGAARYLMGETSVRAARSGLAELKRVKITKRTLILRSSVGALDRKLARIARAGIRLTS